MTLRKEWLFLFDCDAERRCKSQSLMTWSSKNSERSPGTRPSDRLSYLLVLNRLFKANSLPRCGCFKKHRKRMSLSLRGTTRIWKLTRSLLMRVKVRMSTSQVCWTRTRDKTYFSPRKISSNMIRSTERSLKMKRKYFLISTLMTRKIRKQREQQKEVRQSQLRHNLNKLLLWSKP